MPHPLVRSLRFARTELIRGLEGVLPAEAIKRFEPMNAISWNVGHLANQENFYWIYLAKGDQLVPKLRKLVGTGQPASTPPLDEMWAAWREITTAADPYLNSLTENDLAQHYEFRGREWPENIGTLLLRTTHHYWYHLGECMAIRQMLGHTNLPEFVGNMATGNYRG